VLRRRFLRAHRHSAEPRQISRFGGPRLSGGFYLRQYVVCLLLAHALAQALELRPYMLAAEFFLEPGDRLQGRIFP
jgi:hypothetical protein